MRPMLTTLGGMLDISSLVNDGDLCNDDGVDPDTGSGIMHPLHFKLLNSGAILDKMCLFVIKYF